MRRARNHGLCVMMIGLSLSLVFAGDGPAKGWKAGVAKVVITPQKSVWLAGYASRKKPSEGKIQDLYAKALALEDSQGRRLVIVTSDLIGFSRSISEKVAEQVRNRAGLSRNQLLLTSSHTHTGPVIRDSLIDMYELGPDHASAIARYTANLETQLVNLVAEAIKNLAPAKLFYGKGHANFAVNRREPSPTGYKIGVNPDGPVDRGVPVLRVEDSSGKLQAVLMGYACHNTTLTGEFYQFSGDYAGFAQSDLEKQYPGVVALFVMGCGADANPRPRSSLELARQHGNSLAAAVSQVLASPMALVEDSLKTRLDYVDLPLVLPSRDEFARRLQESDVYRQRHARRMLQMRKIPNSYRYPIQVCQLGSNLTIIALAGEVVVDYALRLQKELKSDQLWTIGYANDVFAYIPSVRVLREGGYEANQSGIYYGMPGPFAEPVEELIIGKASRMVAKLKPR